jgi:MFS family permease
MHIRFPFRHLKFPKEYLKLPKAIKVSFVVIFLYYLGWGLSLAYYPIYFKTILVSYSNVGYVYAIYYLTSLFVGLIFGSLLDKLNKKKIIRFILLLYFPFSFFLLNIKSLLSFIIFNVYHGIIASGLWVSFESYVRKHSPKDKAVECIALYDLASILALIFGYLISAFLITKFYFNIFYFISFFAFIAFFASILLPDREKNDFKINLFKNIAKEFKDFIENKSLKRLSIILFLYVVSIGNLSMIFPLFLNYLGSSLWQVGIIFFIMELPYLFEGFFALVKKRKQLVFSLTSILIIIFFLLFFVKNINIIFLITLIMGVCFAGIGPVISGKLTETMPKTRQGELSGMLHVIRNIGFMFSSFFAGQISETFGINFIFLFNSLFLFIFLLLLIRTKI